MEIMNKLTMRSIAGAEVKTLLGESQEQIEFALVLGFAYAEKKGDRPTQFGDNVWIEGNFKAKNLITKKEFQSTKLYPPEIMHNLIASQIYEAGPDPKIQFAFVIGIKKSKAVIGYEYMIRSLIEPKEENNPFAAIEQKLSTALPYAGDNYENK